MFWEFGGGGLMLGVGVMWEMFGGGFECLVFFFLGVGGGFEEGVEVSGESGGKLWEMCLRRVLC